MSLWSSDHPSPLCLFLPNADILPDFPASNVQRRGKVSKPTIYLSKSSSRDSPSEGKMEQRCSETQKRNRDGLCRQVLWRTAATRTCIQILCFEKCGTRVVDRGRSRCSAACLSRFCVKRGEEICSPLLRSRAPLLSSGHRCLARFVLDRLRGLSTHRGFPFRLVVRPLLETTGFFGGTTGLNCVRIVGPRASSATAAGLAIAAGVSLPPLVS